MLALHCFRCHLIRLSPPLRDLTRPILRFIPRSKLSDTYLRDTPDGRTPITDCNPEARAYAHLAGPRHDGGTDWHAHVPQWWPMVLCTLPPHVGKPLPTYVGPAFPGASSNHVSSIRPMDKPVYVGQPTDVWSLRVPRSSTRTCHCHDGGASRTRPPAPPRMELGRDGVPRHVPVGLLPKFRSRSIARGKGRLPTRVESPTAPRGGRDLWVSPLAPLAAQGHRRHYAFISRAAGPPSRRWVAGAVAKGLEEEDAAHVQITFTLS